MMILKVIVLLGVILGNVSADSKNCKYAKFTLSHSFCLERNPKCKISDAGINDKEKDLLLKLHNDYRSKVALGKESRAGGLPPAADMLEMEWDDELASIAQKYAEQCNMTHDCTDCRRVERFLVGQNLFHILTINEHKSKEESFKRGVDDWYDELEVFNKDIVPAFKPKEGGGRPYGHLTQLIWADSYKLGCGSVQYKDESNWFALLLVCNYGPTGNFMMKPVYWKGKTASGCPEGATKSKYPGLCKMPPDNKSKTS